MSVGWDRQALLAPISEAQPCGVDLDDPANYKKDETPILTQLDAFRLFGQSRSPEAPPDVEEGEKEKERARPPLNWDQIRDVSLAALGKSKDLRVLSYLGAALLRTDGLPQFTQTLTLASQWLESYWKYVYPLIDEDIVIRRNALNCFADPMAVVDRVWRLPLVVSKQHGRWSLRDLDMLSGRAQVGPKDTRPDEGAVLAAFKEMPLEELTMLDESVAAAVTAIHAMDDRMRGGGGAEASPDFGPLSAHFAKLNQWLKEQLAVRTAAADAATTPLGASRAAGYTGGAIRSRQEAIYALDAVAEFFRSSEPSSPIPMIVERAKRLVDKNFLQVLADIAPDAVASARTAGGLKE